MYNFSSGANFVPLEYLVDKLAGKGLVLASVNIGQDAAKYPTMPRTIPSTKNSVVQSVNCAKDEKPWEERYRLEDFLSTSRER